MERTADQIKHHKKNRSEAQANLHYCCCTKKRITAAPITPTIYSTDGTINTLRILLYENSTLEFSGNVPIATWTLVDSGSSGFNYQPVSRSTVIATGAGAPTLVGAEANINFHFVSDARLGKVA